jgi:hypothetical protein
MKAHAASLAAAGLFSWLVSPLSTSSVKPAGLPDGYEAELLGEVRVTHYTHHETGSRLTSSGYVLTDGDAGRVCAISRDWWRTRVKDGDLIWIPGHVEPCRALDTMALRNSKGFRQRHWIDVYHTDRQASLDFGIQRAPAYLLRAAKARFSGQPFQNSRRREF